MEERRPSLAVEMRRMTKGGSLCHLGRHSGKAVPNELPFSPSCCVFEMTATFLRIRSVENDRPIDLSGM